MQYICTTIAQLWIAVILLYFSYLYPDLKVLNFLLGFIVGGQCGYTSLNTLALLNIGRNTAPSLK